MPTEDYITDLYDYLDRDWSSYGKLRRFKTRQEIYDTAEEYFRTHKDTAWMLSNTIYLDKEVDEYISTRRMELDTEGNIVSYLWERMYQKLYDAVENELKKYDDEIFKAHNLKMYDAFYESGNYEHWDELFNRCMEDWYDQFQDTLKEELGQYFDWWKQIDQIGRTSSFYLWGRHYDSNGKWYLEDDIIDDVTKYLPNDCNGSTVDYDYNQTERLVLRDRWYNEENMSDEDILELTTDKIIEQLPEYIEWLLHDQKVIREVLKEYKDNQVQWFKDYVADRAEYDEVFES